MTYGARLRELRAERQLSLREIEERGGPNKDTMSLIERGVHKPQPQTFGRIAKALDMGVAELRVELEATERPLAQAPPLQDRLFNGGSEERGAFIERCKRYVEARVAHYENRLAVVKRGGLFPGFGGAKTLQDDAFEEFSQFRDLTNGELRERWLDDPDVPEAVEEELVFDLVEVQKLFLQVVGSIGDAVKELAETEPEKEEAERRDEQHRERTRDIGKSA